MAILSTCTHAVVCTTTNHFCQHSLVANYSHHYGCSYKFYYVSSEIVDSNNTHTLQRARANCTSSNTNTHKRTVFYTTQILRQNSIQMRKQIHIRFNTIWTKYTIMMTSSNWSIFRVTDPLCGEFTGHRWIPRTKGQWRGALMVSLICALNKRLSKQSWGWWFKTQSRSLIRHRNDYFRRWFAFVMFLWLQFQSYDRSQLWNNRLCLQHKPGLTAL